MFDLENRDLPDQSSARRGTKKIAGYEIIEEVGRGAMGVVYKARQISMERIVALKILPPAMAKDEQKRLRFLREARAAGKLSHPNLVTVHDVGSEKGVYYIAMEFINGCSALQKLKRDGVFSEEKLFRLAQEVTGALRAAHQSGIIHRDVKPDNILLDGDEKAHLADLGLAGIEREREIGEGRTTEVADGHLTLDGAMMGTPHYMSPEQVRGQKADVRSDLYSLGATLFTLLSGHTPFQGRNGKEIMQAKLKEEAPSPVAWNPDLSPEFTEFIQKLMRRDPGERYANADECLTVLEKIQRKRLLASKKRPTPANPTPAVVQKKAARVVRRRVSTPNSLPLAFALLAAVAVVFFAVFVLSRSGNSGAVGSTGASEKKGSFPAPTVFHPVPEKNVVTDSAKEKDQALEQMRTRLRERAGVSISGALKDAEELLAGERNEARRREIQREIAGLRQELERRRLEWDETQTRAKAQAAGEEFAAALETLASFHRDPEHETLNQEWESLRQELSAGMATAVERDGKNLDRLLARGDLSAAETALRKLEKSAGRAAARFLAAQRAFEALNKDSVQADRQLWSETLAALEPLFVGPAGEARFSFAQAAGRLDSVALKLKTSAAKQKALECAKILNGAAELWAVLPRLTAERKEPVRLAVIGGKNNATLTALDARGVTLRAESANEISRLSWSDLRSEEAAGIVEVLCHDSGSFDTLAAAGMAALYWRNSSAALRLFRLAAEKSGETKKYDLDAYVAEARQGLEREAEAEFKAVAEALKRNDWRTAGRHLARLNGDLRDAEAVKKSRTELVALNRKFQEMEQNAPEAIAERRRTAAAELRNSGWNVIDGDWEAIAGEDGAYRLTEGRLRTAAFNAVVSMHFLPDNDKTTVEVYVRHYGNTRQWLSNLHEFLAVHREIKVGEGFGVSVTGGRAEIYGSREQPYNWWTFRMVGKGREAKKARVQAPLFIPYVPMVLSTEATPLAQVTEVIVKSDHDALEITFGGKRVFQSNHKLNHPYGDVMIRISGGAKIIKPTLSRP